MTDHDAPACMRDPAYRALVKEHARLRRLALEHGIDPDTADPTDAATASDH